MEMNCNDWNMMKRGQEMVGWGWNELQARPEQGGRVAFRRDEDKICSLHCTLKWKR